jgi:hypothetical protein
MLKLAGLVLLVALILIGALMPLKYTARMHLPKKRAVAPPRNGADAAPGGKQDPDD